ncbi:MFS transporter [Nonomuraea sp. NPDC050153]|uniref:MFS transporter n=1 Tax=Nonomuraea sp. NPDC050153 TaxID=3364359 RepID=UPI00379918C0
MTAPAGRFRDALAIAEFRAIFVAHIVSMTGTVLAQLALTVLVYVRTDSPLLAAVTFALPMLPQLVAGTLLSALVDRVPNRRLLVGCNLVSAVLAAAMAIPGAPTAALLALGFALGLIRPVFGGARAATMPQVLPGDAYVPGRSLMRVVAQVAQIGGFAVSGIALTLVSPGTLLLADAVSFGLSAALLRFGTRERPPTAGSGQSLVRDSLSGIGRLMAVRPLRRLLVFGWAVPAFAVAPEALAVPYSAELSANDTVGAGLLLTALPLGTVVAEFAGNWTLSAGRQIRLMAALAALCFLPLLAFAFRPPIPVAAGLLFVAGLGASFQLGLDRTLLDAAPKELLARALGVRASWMMFFQGLGFAVAGLAAEFAPVTAVITGAALCGLLAAGVFALSGVQPRYVALADQALGQDPQGER